jgi:hypothetical protein
VWGVRLLKLHTKLGQSLRVSQDGYKGGKGERGKGKNRREADDKTRLC